MDTNFRLAGIRDFLEREESRHDERDDSHNIMRPFMEGRRTHDASLMVDTAYRRSGNNDLDPFTAFVSRRHTDMHHYRYG